MDVSKVLKLYEQFVQDIYPHLVPNLQFLQEALIELNADIHTISLIETTLPYPTVNIGYIVNDQRLSISVSKDHFFMLDIPKSYKGPRLFTTYSRPRIDLLVILKSFIKQP